MTYKGSQRGFKGGKKVVRSNAQDQSVKGRSESEKLINEEVQKVKVKSSKITKLRGILDGEE